MVQISHEFIRKLTERYYKSPHIPFRDAAEIFKYWHEQNPSELERIAKSVDVKLDDLFAGDVVSAQKVMTVQKDPDKPVDEFYSSLETQLRMAFHKTLDKNTLEIFEKVGLGHFARDVLMVDIAKSTENLTHAVTQTLNLYGFIETENYWAASYNGKEVPLDFFKEIKSPILLPYNDFMNVVKFSRGLENMVLIMHHKSQKDAKEADYHARSLIGNCILVPDLPVLTEEEACEKYKGRKFMDSVLDPLTWAFTEGFVVKFGDRKYSYHPRVLLEALTKHLDNPQHLYFFRRIIGYDPEKVPRPDLNALILNSEIESLKMQTGQAIPSRDKSKAESIQSVPLDFNVGNVKVDVSSFVPLLNTENFKRMAGVKSLGNLTHLAIPYGLQSRLEHSIGVLHMARILCNRFSITGKDEVKVEAYALSHDCGHLTGSHVTEDYFKALSGFDHESFGIDIMRKSKDALDGVINVEEVVALFEHRDPLHKIVDGPFGADRLYYMSIDPNETGQKKTYDPLVLLPWLKWKNNEIVVTEMPEMAFEFLDTRARLYEELYFSPSTLIADAYEKKMLIAAGIKHPFQKVRLHNNGALDFVPKEGVELDFWRLTDSMFQYFLCNHPDKEANEIMRHLIGVYHRAPHQTVAALKLPGGEAEPSVAIPIYKWMKFANVNPMVETVSEEKLERYTKEWRNPARQHELEVEIAKRSGLPARHIIAASLPRLHKLASEYAPVSKGSEVKSLFDWHPEYKDKFLERTQRMACLRIAMHPQMYMYGREFFMRNPLSKIVAEVYGK